MDAPSASSRAVDALRLLAEAGEALHATLDFERTLQAVARLAVPTLGDYCVFDLMTEDGVRRIATAHADPAREALAAELQKYPPSLTRTGPVIRVLTTGQPLLIPDWDADRAGWQAPDKQYYFVVERLNPRSILSVPLRDREGKVLGALTFIYASSGRRHDAEDQRVAEALASRATSAIVNANLHRSVLESREQLEQQGLELELQAQQLQDQTAEMEVQQEELEQHAEELLTINEELQQTNEELAQARDAAERANGYITGILAAIADPFVVHDAEWRFRFVNDAAEVVFMERVGNRDILIGHSLWELYPDLVGTRFEREMRRAQQERVPVVFEEFYPARGTWSEQRCYPLPDGGVATIWRDTSEARRAEERLHYLTRASAILASSLDYATTVAQVAQLLVPKLADWCGVQLLDANGKLEQLAVAHADPAKVSWARELDRRFPADMDSPTGAPNVLRTGQPELYADITDEMLVAGAMNEEHLAILREVGMRSVLIVPLTARGRVLGVMSLVSAESGRRYTDAEQALAQELADRAALAIDNARLYSESEQARTDAVAANRAKSDFLAHMSHELRTPLNAIGGYAELMELGLHGALTSEQGEAVRRIRRAQRHLLGLINDVLNFARLEAAQVRYDLQPLSVKEIVAGLDIMIGPQLDTRSLRYELSPVAPSLSARGDADKVRQILLNLLSNAVKFTQPGGMVRVSAARVGLMVAIAVSDTGSGIPADKCDSVFEPFVQLDRTLSSAHEGTGLGLAISRDLARGMGGDLSVESELGEGSTFTLTLPAA